MSYSFQKFYKQVSTIKPSNFALAAIVVAISVFLFGGGIYLIIVKPYPAIYYGGRFLFVDPQLSEQWVSDSIIAMILFAFGVIGLLLMYQSTKYAYNPRQAYLMLMIGVALFIIAYISVEAIIHYWKGV
ncbi:MAG: hypothetical protein NZ932_07555 [Candidatus Bathyarchaeota archaeon]|nr:hypothetical protein [Candidatus Bathyarchaeota archaeon]